MRRTSAAAPTQEISDDKLNMPLLRRDDASGMLFVNFDREILQVIREAKFLQRMAIDVPESARMVLLQEEKFKAYYAELSFSLKEYERVLSLVPPVHFVVLSRADFANTLLEMLRRHDLAAGMPTNVLMISGPSKTSDIEQTLVYGVHGPKELVVLLTE